MAYQKSLIDRGVFVKHDYKKHQPIGVSSTVNIAKAILSLKSFIEDNAKTGLATLYMAERDLYRPLREHLQSLLPVPTLVDTEASLKRLTNPLQKTDISIRDLFEVNQPRLSNFKSFCFIEIKSVFFGEKISGKAISDDLEKLLECEDKYGAKCFFTLVGLKTELKKSQSALSLLGNIGVDSKAFKVVTCNNKNAWLMPSGSSMQGQLQIFVWSVSSSSQFPKGFTSRSYSIFQQE